MHHRTALAIALAVTVVISSLALASGAVRAAPIVGTPAAPHPAATDAISPVAYYGCGSTFSVGYSCGGVYFSAYDPSDTSAIVSLFDLNASRDGLGSGPVKTWTVSFATSVYNDSILWGGHYELPLTLAAGGWWNLTINGTVGGATYANFYVHTYDVSMTPTQNVVLAQHSTKILYFVSKTVNSAPMTNITSLTVTAQYLTNTATLANLPGSPMTLPVMAWGSFSVSVPSDASTSGYIEFTLWANMTAGTFANSETGVLDVDVGYVGNPTVTLGACPTGCTGSSFTTGTPVYVTVRATIFGISYETAAVGLTATFQFLSGVTSVTPTGGFPHSLVTNATGGGEILFIASSPPFTTTGTNSVQVTLTDPLNAGASYGPTTATFGLTNQSAATTQLQVFLDSAQYYGGDTITANWQLGSINSTVTQGWTASAWWAWEDATGNFLSSGTIGSTSTQGSFTFTAPLNYSGSITVYVDANNATSSLESSRGAYVTTPAIFLNSPSFYYTAGSTVTVSVTTEGSIFQSAVLYKTVTDSFGDVLQTGTFTGNQIQVAIPQVGAPTYIAVQVAAQDPTYGVVGQASLQVDEGNGYIVTAGVSTVSNYVDGSFQPGQTISIHYTISAVGTAVLSKMFTVEVYPYGTSLSSSSGLTELETSASSGDVSYTIPSGMPSGEQLVEVYVIAQGCYSGCYAGTDFAVNVQSSPSALSYELGAGSGLTVGWLVLFLLILIVAIVLFLALRRKGGGRPMMMKPVTAPGSDSASSGSSSGGGSGAPPGAWQEGSSASNPPLPNPPKSS